MVKLEGQDFVAFQAITAMVMDLQLQYSNIQRSLALYARLIERTTVTHEEAISKHLSAFRNFCVGNREAIKTKSLEALSTKIVKYSDNVYINFERLFKHTKTDQASADIIWKHLQTISAIIDPAGGALAVLKSEKEESAGMDNILGDILRTVEENVGDDVDNPTQAIGKMLSSGALNKIMTDMSDKMQSGELDIPQMLGSIQKMMPKNDGGPDLTQITQQMSQMFGMLNQQPRVEEQD